jgi:hypothetical protein
MSPPAMIVATGELPARVPLAQDGDELRLELAMWGHGAVSYRGGVEAANPRKTPGGMNARAVGCVSPFAVAAGRSISMSNNPSQGADHGG